MKTLIKTKKDFQNAGRWDIDFHLPAEGIRKFPNGLLKRVDQVAFVVKDKRDPSSAPESVFQYIDISAVDVSTGVIANPQDIEGSEAPSRARKVVRAFDIVVLTCRPTRVQLPSFQSSCTMKSRQRDFLLCELIMTLIHTISTMRCGYPAH